MRTFFPAYPRLWKNPVVVASSMLVVWCSFVMGQENRSASPQSDAVEQAALKVLNESDWAHTVTPTIQDTACTFQNPAFPELFPEDKAQLIDASASVPPNEVVKPDSSEYLIRFQSAKPVQAAAQQLLALGEKWSNYGPRRSVSETHGPTDLSNAQYNIADMITIAVILKRSDPDGTSLFDYGYANNGKTLPSSGFRVWPCAGLRTSNGQVFAHIVPVPFGDGRGFRTLQLSFPRLIDGKPLISKLHEKVEFRLVAKQRVFEATFFVNASDVLDGSEKSLYLPSAFTDSKEIARQ